MKGMVVAPEPLAAEAGASIFKKGGNAIDASIAAMFVQGVVNPMLCGIGGTGLMFVHIEELNKTVLIDCSCTMGSGKVPKEWEANYIGRSEAYGRYILKDEENQIGYKSIMIPGVVMGAWEAFQKYGSGQVTWKELLYPAVTYAKDGFKVYPYIAEFWSGRSAASPGYPSLDFKMDQSKAASSLYGTPRKTGEWFVQGKYGNTLEKLAKHGGNDFYTGEIGEKIAKDLELHEAFISKDDLANYDVFETEPLLGTYRGYEIRAAVSGCSSSPQIVSMLQIMEGFDLNKYEHNSPAYIDLLSRAMRASFVDHVKLKGDPPLSIAMNLLPKYTSKERAEFWQEKIKKDPISGTSYPTGLGSDTTHVSVIDELGNAVSWTHTLGSLAGSGVITEELGFLYNNFVGHFNPLQGYWDSIIPGKRGGGGSPLLIYKDGELVMAIGAPGGSRIFTAIMQVLINVIDFDMSLKEAVEAPRFHSEEKDIIYLEPSLSEEIEKELLKTYKVIRSSYMSRVQAVWKDPSSGAFTAGADPRGGKGEAVIA